ncbi:hypothetical protein LD85_1760 [Saccharolobus islandicus L.D.8.5]|uniref:Uncharacterized protein n=1 Tax=Saccharolobus islandicus (strain L.D.8.5 / Lassen \|nr:hypothetical protein LD85_1760 [Sulfolobus islandicus L.D.8.5]
MSSPSKFDTYFKTFNRFLDKGNEDRVSYEVSIYKKVI